MAVYRTRKRRLAPTPTKHRRPLRVRTTSRRGSSAAAEKPHQSNKAAGAPARSRQRLSGLLRRSRGRRKVVITNGHPPPSRECLAGFRRPVLKER